MKAWVPVVAAAVVGCAVGAIIFSGDNSKAKPAPEAAALMKEVDAMIVGDVSLHLIEIPDRIMPYRCVLLTTPKDARMFCPADAVAPAQ